MKFTSFFQKIKAWLNALPLYIWSILGGATVVIVIAVLVLSSVLGSFRPRSTGEHSLANALSETVSYLPYFKGGSLYYYKDGKNTVAAEKIYTSAGEDLLYDSDYALDVNSGRLLYIEADSNATLKYFDGSKTKTLGSHVLSWRTVTGMESIAYTTKQTGSELGLLFLYAGGKLMTLGTDVLSSSIRFSQNGKYLFALKPNTYPAMNYTLFRYSMDGKSTILNKDCKEIMWISEDGSSIATGTAADDTVYNYTLYSDYCKKSLDISGVYLPAVSGDQSVMYLLAAYDATAEAGTLTAVDTRTLKTLEMATNVNFFNAAAVTDSSKGMVYSIKVSDEDDIALFDLYYGTVKGETIKLVKNAYESTLYSIALNTQKQQGYLLVQGSTIDRNGLYEVSWKKDKLTSRTVETGALDGMVYYEQPDRITYVKSPADNIAALYQLSFGGKPQLLAEDCAVTYDDYYGTFTSQSVLSNDGNRVLYFTEYAINSDETVSTGTLNLYDMVTNTRVAVNTQVSSSFGSMPTTDGKMSQIYYLQQNDDTFDLYFYNGKTSQLLDTAVHGSLSVTTD